jgi:hypothetical protein
MDGANKRVTRSNIPSDAIITRKCSKETKCTKKHTASCGVGGAIDLCEGAGSETTTDVDAAGNGGWTRQDDHCMK